MPPIASAESALTVASPVGISLVVIYLWWIVAAIWGPFSDPAERTGQLLLSVLLVLLLSAVHELGHALAGRIAGLRFRSITVGPLSLVRRSGGSKLTANSHWVRFAGCVEHEVARGETTRESLAVSALGGPAANLILATLMIVVGAGSELVRDLATWSCFFGFFNLLPLRLNGQTSDGALVLRLLSSDPKEVEWRRRLLDEPLIRQLPVRSGSPSESVDHVGADGVGH